MTRSSASGPAEKRSRSPSARFSSSRARAHRSRQRCPAPSGTRSSGPDQRLTENDLAQVVEQADDAHLFGGLEIGLLGDEGAGPRARQRMIPESRKSVVHHLQNTGTEHQTLVRVEAEHGDGVGDRGNRLREAVESRIDELEVAETTWSLAISAPSWRAVVCSSSTISTIFTTTWGSVGRLPDFSIRARTRALRSSGSSVALPIAVANPGAAPTDDGARCP